MLLGRVQPEIDSNEALQNPFPTVFEHIKAAKKLDKNQVAVFGSWTILNRIVEHVPGSICVNAGYSTYQTNDKELSMLSELQFQTLMPWDTRHDVYTWRFAKDHLITHRPSVFYLALGETDDWAHSGQYDRVMEALSRADDYLKELWTWLQSQEEYRGNTSILITTDHGRGGGEVGWKDHGRDLPGSENAWMAFVGPKVTRRGIWQPAVQLTLGQVAATLLEWVGLSWRDYHPNCCPPVDFTRGKSSL